MFNIVSHAKTYFYDFLRRFLLMALIICSSCGKTFSNLAESCPKCGLPLNICTVGETKHVRGLPQLRHIFKGKFKVPLILLIIIASIIFAFSYSNYYLNKGNLAAANAQLETARSYYQKAFLSPQARISIEGIDYYKAAWQLIWEGEYDAAASMLGKIQTTASVFVLERNAKNVISIAKIKEYEGRKHITIYLKNGQIMYE